MTQKLFASLAPRRRRLSPCLLPLNMDDVICWFVVACCCRTECNSTVFHGLRPAQPNGLPACQCLSFGEGSRLMEASEKKQLALTGGFTPCTA